MLWIATQDHKSLLNVKEVTIDGKKIEGVIGSTSMSHWSKILGKYESKERAMEVLRDIFTMLKENNDTYVTYTMPDE